MTDDEDDLSRQIQMVAGMVTGNKRDQDDIAKLATKAELRTKRNASRVFDLQARYMKTTLATDHLVTDLARRVERLEAETVAGQSKRLLEVREEIARLKTLEEVRNRNDESGQHDLAALRRDIAKERDAGRKTVTTVLETNKGLIQLMLTGAATISALIHWLIN